MNETLPLRTEVLVLRDAEFFSGPQGVLDGGASSAPLQTARYMYTPQGCDNALGATQLYPSRQGEKGLKCSREKILKARTVVGTEDERLAI